jgi:hypothetical protein
MRPAGSHRGGDALDILLVMVFLLGIYLEYAPRIAAGVPVPAALAGVAGMLLLIRHYRRIGTTQVLALAGVIILYLVSILCVSNSLYLGERFKGFIQIAYSLTIGYGLFVTLTQFDRDLLARIFLYFCLAILIGCALENYTGFRAVSDAVREVLFHQYVYDSAVRDEALYGAVRPKLFTSEPSYVAYGVTLYAFAWYVLSRSAWKTVGFLGLIGCGLFLIRSPTLVLGAGLIVPYQVFLAGRSAWGRVSSHSTTVSRIIVLCIVLVAAVGVAGRGVFSARLHDISSGSDPSFFYRIMGPALVAKDSLASSPLAGAGLAGEDMIAGRIVQIYMSSPAFSAAWQFDKPNEVLTNYFWHHWIYLGLGWGVAILLALTGFLRTLGPPSAWFCWSVWVILGQASGAYVSPKPWTTLMIACAIAILHHRQPALVAYRPSTPFPRDALVASRSGYAR